MSAARPASSAASSPCSSATGSSQSVGASCCPRSAAERTPSSTINNLPCAGRWPPARPLTLTAAGDLFADTPLTEAELNEAEAAERAKGLLEKVIINRHALKNALLPVVTVIGMEFAFLMGGLVVTEQVFNLNGLGKLFVEAVLNHDYNMTQQLVMLVALIFILTNFFVDLLYAWLDPRIRYA